MPRGFDKLAVTEENEGDEVVFDNPTYGGVWGDFQGGWVVAVTDCQAVDADRIAALAGGQVALIEVEHSFEQVDQFRDALVAEVVAAGVEWSIAIDSTMTGRIIRLGVADIASLPEDFAADIPASAFVIEEVQPVTEGG